LVQNVAINIHFYSYFITHFDVWILLPLLYVHFVLPIVEKDMVAAPVIEPSGHGSLQRANAFHFVANLAQNWPFWWRANPVMMLEIKLIIILL
jgi:hypothetical protein